MSLLDSNLAKAENPFGQRYIENFGWKPVVHGDLYDRQITSLINSKNARARSLPGQWHAESIGGKSVDHGEGYGEESMSPFKSMCNYLIL